MTTETIHQGDKVKVMMKIEKESGWKNVWVEEMNAFLPGGSLHRVYTAKTWQDGVRFYEDETFGFPTGSIEIVMKYNDPNINLTEKEKLIKLKQELRRSLGR